MLKTYDLKTWIESQSPPADGVSMDTPPEGQPNNVITVRLTGGLGLEFEDALDRPTFTVFFRGANGRIAENLAWWFDSLWINAAGSQPSFEIGGYRVLGAGRFGGPPSYVGTEDITTTGSGGRVTRSATYWCRIVR